MERKHFLKTGIFGLTTVVTGSAITRDNKRQNSPAEDECEVSPGETKGPFPTKTPSKMLQPNIKSDRTGVALLISLSIVDKTNKCKPLAGANVDIALRGIEAGVDPRSSSPPHHAQHQ